MCEQTRKQARASKFLRRTSRSCSIARSVLNKGRIEKLGCKEEDFRWKDSFDMVSVTVGGCSCSGMAFILICIA